METLLIGFLGCGGLAGLAFLFMNIMGKGKKSDILNAVHKVKQENKLREIKKIDKKQNAIRVEIKKNEQVAENTKKRVKRIQEAAAAKINEVLSEDKAVVDSVNEFNDGLEDW